ncbi:hypothetical protein GC163_12575 [bacterium]|nr:hypothetical protein [bacterium]
MADLAIKGMSIACEFSSGTYTNIANIENFSGPNPEIDMFEVAYLGDSYVTKKPTVINSGQLTLTIGYDPDNTTHQNLRTNFVAGTVKSFRVSFTDNTPTTFTFDGFVKSFSITGGTSRDQNKAEVVIEITGSITVA